MNSRLIVKIFLAAEIGALLLLKQLFGAGSTPEDKQNLFEPKKKTCRITYTSTMEGSTKYTIAVLVTMSIAIRAVTIWQICVLRVACKMFTIYCCIAIQMWLLSYQ